MIFDIEWKKGMNGFGIYFSEKEKGVIVVDGFVREDPVEKGAAEEYNDQLSTPILVQDRLLRINNVDIRHADVLDVIDMLRSVPDGKTTLTFQRDRSVWPLIHEEVSIVKQSYRHPAKIPMIQPSDCLQLVLEQTSKRYFWSTYETLIILERLNDLGIFTAHELKQQIVNSSCESFARRLQTSELPPLRPDTIGFMRNSIVEIDSDLP